MSDENNEQVDLEQYRAQLDDEVEKRNDMELSRTMMHVLSMYPHLYQVYKPLAEAEVRDPIARLYQDGGKFGWYMRKLIIQFSGRETEHEHYVCAQDVRDHLAEIFSFPYEFEMTFWRVRANDTRTPSRPTEYSLEGNSQMLPIVTKEEVYDVRIMIGDFLLMLGQLARRINSCALPRVIQLLIDTKLKPMYGEPLPPEQAARIADEIVHCYDVVRCELQLLAPAERASLQYPRIPRHPPYYDDICPPEEEDMSADCKTDYCRSESWKRFQRAYASLFPHADDLGRKTDPLQILEERIASLAKIYESGNPAQGRVKDDIDYNLLAELLISELHLPYTKYYDEYEEREWGGETWQEQVTDTFYDDTPQQETKEDIIALIRTILNAAVKLATESGSNSLNDWLTAQMLFEKRNGDFSSEVVHDAEQAEADLDKFLQLFSQSQKRLWVDWRCHSRQDIEEKRIKTDPGGALMEGIHKAVETTDKNTAQIAKEIVPQNGRPVKGKAMYSQKEIAKMLDCHEDTIRRWERGDGAPAGYSKKLRQKGDPTALEEFIRTYKASNRVKDALNTKHVKHNLSEEQIHREALK